MDKVIERLGDDAMILETIKRDGRIEMIATDDSPTTSLQSPRVDVSDTTELAFASAAANRLTAVDGGLQAGIPQTKKADRLDLNIGATTAFTDLLDQQMVETVKGAQYDRPSDRSDGKHLITNGYS
jgi:hypothetical protein